MEDPRGGVRHVIPEKGNYKKVDKELEKKMYGKYSIEEIVEATLSTLNNKKL
jgi:hypothetical protein